MVVSTNGEASLVISVEDITGKYRTTEEVTDPDTGETRTRDIMDLGEVVKRIVIPETAEGLASGRRLKTSRF